jgi:cell division protein FtsI (penicillin-binding protein 3)
MIFILSIFAGRLLQMQGLDAPAVARTALLKRTSTVALSAHRGDILDGKGAVLATTVERKNVLIDQTKVSRYTRLDNGHQVTVGLDGAAEDLARVLGLPYDVIRPRLIGTSRGAYVAKGITPDLARQVVRLPIPGLGLEDADRRDYPGGTLAANVLGFVSSTTGNAFGGVEGAYNSTLVGMPGSIRYEHALDGTRIPTGLTDEVDPVPGRSIKLTLDRDLQYRAQALLDEQVAATKAESGDVVILDAKTSQVLALATAPTFDPNNPGAAQPADRGNRPLLDVFEPGSTAKVITLAAALEEGVATPESKVTVPPSLRRADRTFGDAEVHGTEKLTVAGVMAQSSNIGTLLTGERVPAAKMYDYLRAFGLGAKTGVGLPESAGMLAPYQDWSDSQRYTVMFGQGLSVTALQAASVFATIANGGVRVEPQLLAGEVGLDGAFRPAPAPTGTRVISADTAEKLRWMMENVVGENGTAAKAEVPGYRVAGKTGTAQAAGKHGGYDGYTASFIGMAPADDPALVIAVILQRPVNGHFGGQVAAPVFQQLMTYALGERKVPPTGTKPPEIPLHWR